MPFCSQCGNAVDAADQFCHRCGARQPAGFAPPQPADPFAGLSPRTAAVLCYIPGIGWIASIIVLASDRFRRDRAVRFHAFQGLYLFVAWLMNAWVFRPISALLNYSLHVRLYSLVDLVLLAMSIFMMIKAAHDQTYALPLFGELAQRSVAEN
ncbi:MAG TPA: hypothetical protein VLW65_18170 [Bryobacteraceae bacterium]|nr:hypothetical protein [Bryobacteraceae bacterium]